MPKELLIIRHSGLRAIPPAEVLAAIPASEMGLPRIDEHIDTSAFSVQIEQGDWGEQDGYLREQASRLLDVADRQGDVGIHYFGLAEIPHVVALGAHLGDERHVVIHDFDRDSNSWAWPQSDGQIIMETRGLPGLPVVTARGDAVLRVEVSASISDEDVREAVGDNVLMSMRVVLGSGLTPAICKVRSEEDLMRVRRAVRDALAGLKEVFPNLDTIHLFLAAPVSVCFAIGQELKPRNSPPIQTYRFRRVEGQPAFKPALLLRGGEGEFRETPLSPEQVSRAEVARGIWSKVIADLEGYLANRPAATPPGAAWYTGLEPRDALERAAPFPSLKALRQLMPDGAAVDPNPFPAEYGFDKDRKLWRISDRLLLGLDTAAGSNEARLQQIIRLFLFHEYLHDFHSLTKYTAAEVGKFANCLEFIDYTADAYALVHQLDFQHLYHHGTVRTDDAKREFLADQIDLVIRSFWAFEPPAPVFEWQVRRMRRYLNWYWRHAQIKRAKRLATVLGLLGRPPHVEIAGLHQFARGRRVLVRLDRLDRGTALELGLVLEDSRLMRLGDSPTLGVSELAKAFMHGQHEELKGFFNAVFEEAAQRSGALPLSDSA